jgi:hypothetical protein
MEYDNDHFTIASQAYSLHSPPPEVLAQSRQQVVGTVL